MFRHSSFRIVSAFSLSLALLISSTPISAADLNRSNSVLGSVRGAGNVQVRGVVVNRESTVFAGDSIHTGSKSYAKVALVNGNRFELLNDTELIVNRQNAQISVGVAAGAMAFNSSKTPVPIRIGDYEIVPAAGSSGAVGFIGNEFAAVRAITGTVTLISLKERKSSVLATGVDHFMSVNASKSPIAELASVAPASFPSAALPQANPQGLNRTTWSVVIAMILGGAIAVAILSTRGEGEGSPSQP